MPIPIQEITNQELVEVIQSENEYLFLLDVRDTNEVEIAKIANSVHIPMNLIPLYLDQIPDGKKIVIYCHRGARSLNVASYLIENGFDETDIYSLKGGIDDWSQSVDNTVKRY